MGKKNQMIQILYHPNKSAPWLSTQWKVPPHALSPTKLCSAGSKGSPSKATNMRIIQQNTESHTAVAGQRAWTLDCARERPGVLRRIADLAPELTKPPGGWAVSWSWSLGSGVCQTWLGKLVGTENLCELKLSLIFSFGKKIEIPYNMGTRWDIVWEII